MAPGLATRSKDATRGHTFQRLPTSRVRKRMSLMPFRQETSADRSPFLDPWLNRSSFTHINPDKWVTCRRHKVQSQSLSKRVPHLVRMRQPNPNESTRGSTSGESMMNPQYRFATPLWTNEVYATLVPRESWECAICSGSQSSPLSCARHKLSTWFGDCGHSTTQ